MGKEYIYQRPKITTRLKELVTLAGFTVAVAVLSIAVMDILVYPVAVAATSYPAVFTAMLKYSLIILPAGVILLLEVRRARMLRKEGLSGRKILAILTHRPLYHLAVFLIIAIIILFVLGILYFLLNYNYYLLYRLSI